MFSVQLTIASYIAIHLIIHCFLQVITDQVVLINISCTMHMVTLAIRAYSLTLSFGYLYNFDMKKVANCDTCENIAICL